MPAKDGNPEIEVTVLVFFSNHCFSRDLKDNEAHDILYENGEPRKFCPIRYKLSFQLPDIINNLGQKMCLYTNRAGWIIAQLTNLDGTVYDYHIYFTLKKDSEKDNGLVMYVNSAHIKDNEEDNSPKFANRMRRKRFSLVALQILFGR